MSLRILARQRRSLFAEHVVNLFSHVEIGVDLGEDALDMALERSNGALEVITLRLRRERTGGDE
ncbi:MAG: hypothetical protein ABR537_13770 [Gemmatimonadales bacterium]